VILHQLGDVQGKEAKVVLVLGLHHSCDWLNLLRDLKYGKYIRGCHTCDCVGWLCGLAHICNGRNGPHIHLVLHHMGIVGEWVRVLGLGGRASI
jgi:hypothetical protein